MDLRMTTETFAQDDQRWLASQHGADTAQPVTLDVSKFTAATHYPDGFIKSGCVIAESASGTMFEPYNPADTTTTAGTAVGILLSGVPVRSGATSVVGALVKHCFVDSSKMPFGTGSSTKGAFDSAAQADLIHVVVR